MAQRILPENRSRLIEFDAGKGCRLVLTWKEYADGLERGRRIRRQKALRERTERKQP